MDWRKKNITYQTKLQVLKCISGNVQIPMWNSAKDIHMWLMAIFHDPPFEHTPQPKTCPPSAAVNHFHSQPYACARFSEWNFHPRRDPSSSVIIFTKTISATSWQTLNGEDEFPVKFHLSPATISLSLFNCVVATPFSRLFQTTKWKLLI